MEFIIGLIAIIFFIFGGIILFGLIIGGIAKKMTPKCPYCKEIVKNNATKCSHCGSNL